MNATISLPTAFLAGLISFLSPCVLPLVPGYLSYISGVSSDQMRDGADAATRRKVIVNSLGFILGFSIVFVALGATATAFGQVLNQKLTLLSQIAGVVIILFGLHTMGLFKIKALYMEKRFQVAAKPAGFFGAILVGLAFAFGWTPCIGPILAAILTYASQSETLNQGIALLLAYSLGLGVPFFATALAINAFFSLFNRIKQHMRKVEIASGLLLVAVGVLIFSNNLSILANVLQSSPAGQALLGIEEKLSR
ncbi:MAG TPA: cytochrome c biogenesis protein CcdA [Pantanalinema sp.]